MKAIDDFLLQKVFYPISRPACRIVGGDNYLLAYVCCALGCFFGIAGNTVAGESVDADAIVGFFSMVAALHVWSVRKTHVASRRIEEGFEKGDTDFRAFFLILGAFVIMVSMACIVVDGRYWYIVLYVADLALLASTLYFTCCVRAPIYNSRSPWWRHD